MNMSRITLFALIYWTDHVQSPSDGTAEPNTKYAYVALSVSNDICTGCKYSRSVLGFRCSVLAMMAIMFSSSASDIMAKNVTT